MSCSWGKCSHDPDCITGCGPTPVQPKPLPTWEELDELVDVDPIKLRDVAWELVRELSKYER